jgi:hypothetical protein
MREALAGACARAGPASAPALLRLVDELLMPALQAEPAARPASARVMLAALDGVAEAS